MKNHNINLSYWIAGLNNAFFWYAPWLLFVYKYINIEQATILQLVGMVTRVVAEIPTGAISDLIGKKKTLVIAFLLSGIGEIAMAFSSTYLNFIIIYILIGLGQSFYSGTIDAFIYDSLLEKGEEGKYPKVLGKSSAYINIATAIATISGGFLFQFWAGLPFLLTGIAKIIGLFFVFSITEPKIDTFVFSLKNFVVQSKLGFTNLFSRSLLNTTLLILILGGFSTIGYEILDDVAVVDWGYSAIGISILYTSLVLISVLSGFFYEYISKKIDSKKIIIIAIFILAINYIFSIWINSYIWTILFLIRVIYSPIKNSAIKDSLNQNTDSNSRATTLSTYELLTKLPFALFGIPIGIMLKNFGVKVFSVGFAASLIGITTIYLITNKFFSKKETAIANLN
jgi:MFS family permease